MPNSNSVFLSSLWHQAQVTTMVKQDEDESTFDEVYTYNHPPFGKMKMDSSESIDNLASSSSIASTRTADIDKITVDIHRLGRNKRIMSMGYLEDSNYRFGDMKKVQSPKQRYSFKSNYSIGFFTYMQNRYDGSSRKKKMLMWSFFGVCISLFAALIAVGFSKGQRNKLSQPEKAALGIRDATSDSFQSENDKVLPSLPTSAPAADAVSITDETESIQLFWNFTTTAIPSTNDPISQSQSRDRPILIDDSNEDSTSQPTQAPV